MFFAYLVAPLVRLLSPARLGAGAEVRASAAAGDRRGLCGFLFGSLAAAVVLLLPVLNHEIGELAKRLQAIWREFRIVARLADGLPDPRASREVREAIDRALIRR